MLSNRRWLVVTLVAALVAAVPTLWCGLFCDDYTLILTSQGRLPFFPHDVDIYRFVDATPGLMQRLTEHGPYPWWSSPDMRLAFFRPLAGLLLKADVRLFGMAPLGYHLHSALWLLALCLVAAALYRRLLPAGALGLAIVLYALHDSHTMAYAWIANRHATVSAVLGLAALAAHLAARERAWRPGWVLAPLGFAVALTAGETTLGVVAYLVAYELFGPKERRLIALLPSLLVVGAFLVFYKLHGCGAAQSATYIDPFAHPLAFLRVAPARALALAGSFFVGPGADLFVSRPETFPLAMVLGAIMLPWVFVLTRRLVRALPPDEGRHLRWLGIGAVLSVVPSLGGFPGSRILFMPSFGGVAVVAVILAHAWRSRSRRAWRYALPLLVLGELVRPIALGLGSTVVYRQLAQQSEHIARDSELPESPADQVVVLATSDLIASVYTDTMRQALQGRPAQAAWWILSMAPHAHRARRTSPSTLELEVDPPGRMLDGLYEGLWRDIDSQPAAVGDVVQLDGLKVTVTAVDHGHPTHLAAAFDRPLDTLWLVVYRDGQLRRVTLPSDGGWLALPRERGPLEP